MNDLIFIVFHKLKSYKLPFDSVIVYLKKQEYYLDIGY